MKVAITSPEDMAVEAVRQLLSPGMLRLMSLWPTRLLGNLGKPQFLFPRGV